MEEFIKQLDISNKDKQLISNNQTLEFIIKLGLKQFHRNKLLSKELTYSETVLFNLLQKYNYRYLTKEQLTDFYNWEVYKDDLGKYIKPNNIVAKIRRVNNKLTDVSIENKYGFGYMLKWKGNV